MKDLKVLLIGKGGREHALAWKLSQSPIVDHIYVVPGNGGTAHGLAKVSNIDNISANDYVNLVSLAKKLHIGLVVAGPDDVVVDGIEGYFRKGRAGSKNSQLKVADVQFQWEFHALLLPKKLHNLKVPKHMPRTLCKGMGFQPLNIATFTTSSRQRTI